MHWELRARKAKSAWGGGTKVKIPLKPISLYNVPNVDTIWVCPRPGRRCFLGYLLP